MTKDDRGVSDEVLARINASGEQRITIVVTPTKEVKDSSTETRPGRPTKYPWTTWLDGKTHEVERGRDFTMPFSTFQSMVHNQAGKRDLVVATMTVSPGVLRFQACADREAAAAAKQEWRSAWYDDGYDGAGPETE